MNFKRARSAEQRAERRRAILATAATMLAEMPVADVSLNELSRRVGLAKSNVLNYFDSREAVLLELSGSELTAWVQDMSAALSGVSPALPCE
ncbi:MAG TPA: TetR/AcrR family transcriptional regulator, partial [Kribbella sp.]|nr:TetR/AcrR family transcriptional regulator [Kribbella sp.]